MDRVKQKKVTKTFLTNWVSWLRRKPKESLSVFSEWNSSDKVYNLEVKDDRLGYRYASSKGKASLVISRDDEIIADYYYETKDLHD